MNGTWINRVRHVSDGEPVNGAIDSRPTRALEGNTRYLKDRIDSAELGEGVFAYGETVEPDALVGMPVYRNHYSARYERALAAVGTDPATGTLFPADSADCVGIIVFKYNGTKADILLAGRHQVDLSAAVIGEATPGRYYLSSATPGMLVQQRPPVSVSVLVYTDDHMAVVQPTQRDFLEDHVHYKVKLYAQPAGTNTIGSLGGHNCHVIEDVDPTKKGWLPANHDIFNAKAPTGAVFGYNLSQHPELARIFPPIPDTAAVLFLDRGDSYAGGTLVPMGPGGLCQVNRNGIWWMSNCQGDAPWPETWSEPLDPLQATDPLPECPRDEEFQIILAYTVMVFTTERTSVTSLRPADDSPLTFTNCDGDPATTGDLTADLNLEFLSADDAQPGFMAFKELDGSIFRRGPVVEGLTAGPNCTLSSLTTQTLPDNSILYQGRVQVTLDAVAGERELPADLIRLAQTQERFHLEIPYIGFDTGRSTSLRMRFYVPVDGLPTNPQVALRMQLLGRSNGSLPIMTVTYRILPRPAALDPPDPLLRSPIPLPGLTAEQVLNINTNVPIWADQYTEVQSLPIPVHPGDTILVTLVRSSTDGYASEVGLMRPTGILTATPPGA
jgi:hypothetical protein